MARPWPGVRLLAAALCLLRPAGLRAAESDGSWAGDDGRSRCLRTPIKYRTRPLTLTRSHPLAHSTILSSTHSRIHPWSDSGGPAHVTDVCVWNHNIVTIYANLDNCLIMY